MWDIEDGLSSLALVSMESGLEGRNNTRTAPVSIAPRTPSQWSPA